MKENSCHEKRRPLLIEQGLFSRLFSLVKIRIEIFLKKQGAIILFGLLPQIKTTKSNQNS